MTVGAKKHGEASVVGRGGQWVLRVGGLCYSF